MTKIAFVGAGSYGFTRRLVSDILTYDAMRDADLAFMDNDRGRLKRAEAVITELLHSQGVAKKPLFTLNRNKALEGADFVIDLVKIGMLEASFMDLDVPKKYGLKQTIGDTACVAGVFRGLRGMPWAIQLCKDIEQLCPKNAVVLNYTNPQTMLVMACAATSRVPFIGLCHSVQGTTRAIANFLNVPYDEVSYEAAGINHMNWITKLERRGKDLYPRLRRAIKKHGIYDPPGGKKKEPMAFLGPARLDMLNRTGYVVTESSTHFPEYVPFYARTDDLIEQYQVPIDQYKRNMANRAKSAEESYQKAIKGELPTPKRSVEYGCQIIHAMLTDQPARVYANVPNWGLVTNLPEFSAVEIACLIDRNGVQPCHFGELPTVVAAMCRMTINVYQLAVEAILKKSRRSVYNALMMDPLTHSKLTIDEIEEIVDTLVENQKPYLGRWLGRKD